MSRHRGPCKLSNTSQPDKGQGSHSREVLPPPSSPKLLQSFLGFSYKVENCEELTNLKRHQNKEKRLQACNNRQARSPTGKKVFPPPSPARLAVGGKPLPAPPPVFHFYADFFLFRQLTSFPSPLARSSLLKSKPLSAASTKPTCSLGWKC